MYTRLYLGHDRIYFTRSARGRDRYGTSLRTLRGAQPAEETAYHLTTRGWVEACLRAGVAGAKRSLADLDAIRAHLAHRRRALRPPPRAEADTEALMCATWAPLPRAGAPHASAGFYFSVLPPLQPEVDRLLQQTAPTSVVRLPFMRSCIYNVAISPPQ